MREYELFVIQEALRATAKLYPQGIVVTGMPYGLPDLVTQSGKQLADSFSMIITSRIDWQILDTEYMQSVGNPRYMD